MSRDQRWGDKTYSQHFEDGMLVNIFELIGVDKPSYLDLGAHHPSDISNTKLLYDRGSRGVNVEANPNLIEAFKKERPEDINLNIGVGTEPGMHDFFMYDEKSGLNTFSYEETKTLEGSIQVKSILKLPVVTVNQVVGNHCKGIFPHLLSCDIEGLDYEVIDNIDFSKSHPIVIIVETRRNDSRRMMAIMQEKKFHAYCRCGENLIFIHQDYFLKAF